MLSGIRTSSNRYIGAFDSTNEPRAPSWEHVVGETTSNSTNLGDMDGIWSVMKRGLKMAIPGIPRLPRLPGLPIPMVHRGFHLGRSPGAAGNTGPGAAGAPGRDPPEGGFRKGGKNFRGKSMANLYTHHLRHPGTRTRKHMGFVPRSHPPTRPTLIPGMMKHRRPRFGDPMLNDISDIAALLSDDGMSGLHHRRRGHPGGIRHQGGGPHAFHPGAIHRKLQHKLHHRPRGMGALLSGIEDDGMGGAIDDITAAAASVVDTASAKVTRLENALYVIIGLSGIAALTGVVTAIRRR